MKMPLLEGFVLLYDRMYITTYTVTATIIQCYYHNYFVGIMCIEFCVHWQKGTCKATFGFSMHLMTRENERIRKRETVFILV